MTDKEEDPPKSKEKKEFEDLLELAGTTGWKNYFIFVLASLSAFITPLPLFSYQFLGATPEHWCFVEELAKNNWTQEQIKFVAIPSYESDGIKEFSECEMYKLDYHLLSSFGYEKVIRMIENKEIRRNETLFCPSRYFVNHPETIVTKWDLVCDRYHLYVTTQGANLFGNLIGSVLIGYFNDKYGRTFMYRICLILYIASGFVNCLSPNIYMYILLRFFITLNAMGFYMSSFVLVIEISSIKQRIFFGSYFPLPWALGIMLTAGISYLFRQWDILQAALTTPALLLILAWWYLPESPRWLILNGKHRQALQFFKSIAKSNGVNLPPDKELLEIMKIIKNEHTSNTELFSKKTLMKAFIEALKKILVVVTNRHLRNKTLAVFFCWFSASMVYYGVSLGSTSLSTNNYLYVFLTGTIEIPSYLFLYPVVAHLGRRKVLIICFLVSGLSILSVMGLVLSDEKGEHSTIKTVLFLVGKFTITAAFQLIWVYTAELYPTNFRSLIIGEASAVARVGSICTPYINDIMVNSSSWSPSALFGIFSVLAGCVSLSLSETTGKILPESIDEKSTNKEDKNEIDNDKYG